MSELGRRGEFQMSATTNYSTRIIEQPYQQSKQRERAVLSIGDPSFVVQFLTERIVRIIGGLRPPRRTALPGAILCI
jgi:hypothetical protein